MSDLPKYFNNNEYSDLTIIVGEQKIPAHKILVASTSPVFLSLVQSADSEGHVKIDGYDFSVVNTVIKYIYNGSIDMSCYSLDVFRFADKYKLKQLHLFHEIYFINHLNCTNVIKLVTFAKDVNSERLRSACIKFICERRSEIVQQNKWEILPIEVLREIFVYLSMNK